MTIREDEVPSARHLAAPPGETVSALFILCTCLPGEWLCSCAQENSLERVFDYPQTPPPPPKCRVSWGAYQSPPGSCQRAPGCSLSGPFFSLMFRVPSPELCVSTSGLLHFPAGVKGTLPALVAGTLQFPRPSLHTDLALHLSDQFLIHFLAKRSDRLWS